MSTANGGAAKRVKVIEASDLKANGGAYSLEGRAPVAVYGVVNAETKAEGGAYAVEGNTAQAVYIVETPQGAIEATTAPLPMIGVTGSAAGNVAIPVYVVGGSLSGGPAPEPPQSFNSMAAVPTGANRDDVLISWDASEYATGYILEYSEDNSAWTEIADTADLTYTHTTPTLGIVTHYYRVKAYNVFGETDWVTVTIAGLLLTGKAYYTLSDGQDIIGGANFSGGTFVVGKIGNGLYHSGGSPVAAGSVYSGAIEPFALSFWVTPTIAPNGYQAIYTIPAEGGGDVFRFWALAGSQFYVAYWDIGGAERGRAWGVTAGTWYHVIFQYDGTDVRLYVNNDAGTVVHTNTPRDFAASGSLTFNECPPSLPITDELYIRRGAGAAFSAAERAALYNAGSGLAYPFQ